MEIQVTNDIGLEAVLAKISMGNSVLDFKWKFEYKPCWTLDMKGYRDVRGWFIWVTFERPDIITGAVGRGRGRSEFVQEGTSLSGVVKTCWLLIELMVRHELMESFKYDGAKIFNPHNSVLALAELQTQHDAALESPHD